ncbi:uncharacterized protein LOC127864330 [Dreissena polymorpha]|uniref:uncharacterized protein LOC127864330 n=1 Tax=Dreissena polymorpha TaxID=45954 RepID=UPI002263B216|nr:uncharacterized protein LOC127864330 [Dreissena polymorpha]XP_052259944.1 uncharacterized protein LOC127864330 [Dreissena polymorpha]
MAKRDNLSINMEQFPENYDHLMNCVTAPSVTLQERGFHAEGQIGTDLGSSSSLSRGGQWPLFSVKRNPSNQATSAQQQKQFQQQSYTKHQQQWCICIKLREDGPHPTPVLTCGSWPAPYPCTDLWVMARTLPLY